MVVRSVKRHQALLVGCGCIAGLAEFVEVVVAVILGGQSD